MKYVSTLAFVAALCLTGPAFAQASSSQASSAPASSSAQPTNGSNGSCSGLAGQKTGVAVPAVTLQSTTKVSIIGVKDCTGLSLADDPGASASLSANPAVRKAMSDAGNTNNDIIGYAMDGATLDVYVKAK